MSDLAMRLTWEATRSLPPSDRVTMMALAEAADDQGRAYLTVYDLAGKVGLGERQVQYIVRGLVNANYVQILPRCDSDGKQLSSLYVITAVYIDQEVFHKTPTIPVPGDEDQLDAPVGVQYSAPPEGEGAVQCTLGVQSSAPPGMGAQPSAPPVVGGAVQCTLGVQSSAPLKKLPITNTKSDQVLTKTKGNAIKTLQGLIRLYPFQTAPSGQSESPGAAAPGLADCAQPAQIIPDLPGEAPGATGGGEEQIFPETDNPYLESPFDPVAWFKGQFGLKRLNRVQYDDLLLAYDVLGLEEYRRVVQWAARKGMPGHKAAASVHSVAVKRQDEQNRRQPDDASPDGAIDLATAPRIKDLPDYDDEADAKFQQGLMRQSLGFVLEGA